MHFSKCLTKANALKTSGWVQLARVCFQGQTLLRNRWRNTGLSTNYFCYWRAIEWNVLLGFFSSHKLFSFLLVFNREVKTCCSKHMFGCCTENMKTAGMKSASLFFPLGSLFPKSSCTICGLCMCPHAHGGNGSSITLSGACISHQVVLTEESQLFW